MRLVSCKVENFGKLHDFTYTFSEGMNLIHEKNGWGKSTLAAFIKAMLYGFEGDRKRDGLENERKRYMPWQQGTYGGELVLSKDGKRISIRRNFGKKASDDVLCVTDADTGLPYEEFGEVPGIRLFEIDSAAFTKTAFISQNDCSSEANGAIFAKLGNLAECMDDINRFENVDGMLKKYLDSNSPTRSTGSLSKAQAHLTDLQAQIREGEGSEEELRQIRIQREEADRQKALLQERGSQLRKLRNDLSTYMEDKGKYDKCLELEQEVARREAEEQRSRALFPGNIPSETEIQASMDEAVRAKGLKEMLEHVRPLDEEMGRLNMLQGAYENPADVERQLKNCSGLCEERSRRKEQVERDQEALNQFMDQNRTGGNSSAGMFILLAIIIMVVGVVCAVLIHMILGILIGLMGVGILGFALGKAKGEKKRQQEILDKQQVLETAVQNSQAQFKELDGRLAENMAKLGVPDVENPYFILNRIENELREYKDLAGKQEIYLRKKADVDKLEGKVQAYIRSLGFAPEENLSGQLAQLLLQLKDLEGKSEETRLAKQKRDAYIPYREIERLRNLPKPDTDKTMEELAQEEELVDRDLQELLSQVQEYDRTERMLTERYNAWLQNSQEYEQLSVEVGEAKKKYDLIKKTKEFLGQAKNSMTAKYTAPIMDGFRKYYGLLTGDEADDIQMDATTKLSVIEYNLPREISSQSTGIRDLIGVCFRMALIGAMYEKEKPFVVMDDPFVNLDDERRERVAAFMDRMTKEYQVIYFTCHEYEARTVG